MSERLTDSESIKSKGMTVLYLNIMAASSAPVIYKMLMLKSEVSDTLWFKEKNVTDFLKAFNNMCDDYNIELIEWLKKICCYCKRYICEYICSLISLKEDN